MINKQWKLLTFLFFISEVVNNSKLSLYFVAVDVTVVNDVEVNVVVLDGDAIVAVAAAVMYM